MSGALDISTCRRDRGSGAAHKHFFSCLCGSIDGAQADTGAHSNRGPVIRTINDEMFCKGDILKVGGPEKKSVLCRRTA